MLARQRIHDQARCMPPLGEATEGHAALHHEQSDRVPFLIDLFV